MTILPKKFGILVSVEFLVINILVKKSRINHILIEFIESGLHQIS